MMSNKRVTLICQQLKVGGREVALLSLADALNQRGWKVEILSFLPGALDGMFTQKGISVKTFPVRPKMKRVLALRQHFLRYRPNIVHTHLFSAGFWGRIAASMSGVPVIIHTEGGMLFEEKKWKRMPAERLLARVSDRIICVAQCIKEHLIEAGGLIAETLVVIPNGVRADDLLGKQLRPMGNPPVLFSAGRLARVKGFDVLIEAFAQLDNFRGKLVLAGDGPEANSLKRLAYSLGIADRVEFLGYRKDVCNLLDNVDLYVAPSRSEGLSNSILEAMAAGVPVVATDVGGNRELLNDVGYIVNPNDPAALAKTIASAIADSDTTTKLVSNARQRVAETYTLERMVTAHERLYRQCLKAKGIHLD